MGSAALERSRSETGYRASWRARRFLRGWPQEARTRAQVLPVAGDVSGLPWTISFAVSFRRRTQFGPYHLSQEGTRPMLDVAFAFAAGEAGSTDLGQRAAAAPRCPRSCRRR